VTWLKSHVYDGLEKLAGAGTGASVCYVTDELRRRRTGGGPATGPREHIVHNGIDAVGGRRFQRPDDLPAGEFHFAAVGRVSPVKGLETALRAVQRLDSAHNPVLNIIGTGPSVAGLEVLARELGLGSRVRFLGFRENIYDYLAHIDVLVMPSHHEGLPYTILEAMSLATPIIASRVGGLAEVLEDGRTALLVEPGDIEGWAAAMGRLLPGSGMGRSLGAAAKEEQAGALTLESMGAAYWQIYSDLVEQKAEGALRSVR
jgi:glycosyltransferase involved in cell wall biosynthesis